MQASHYLLFDRVKIQNANAISSPITYGFPAITGFIGAIHALSRKIPSEQGVSLNGVLIACHECDVQRFRPHDFADYSFNLTRNPIKRDGKTRAIVEEGRVHLEVSLVVEVIAENVRQFRTEEAKQPFELQLQQALFQQRIAGGSVVSIGNVRLFESHETEDILKSLLPAFVLMEAKQELAEVTQILQDPDSQYHIEDATPLQALIETATIHHFPQSEDKWLTGSVKAGKGWLVPIPVGYQGISKQFAAGSMSHCRTQDYPSQYVECLYSLGKWVFPYRLRPNFKQGFWRYQMPENDLYLVTQAD